MAQVSRSARFYRKAESAIIAAVETYNKPNSEYREETFAILALNAWELLLKAKLVAEHSNKASCLYVRETRKTKTGQASKRLHVRRNRTGNAMTLNLGSTIAALEARIPPIPKEIKANLDALTEVRDNAIHYLVAQGDLQRTILGIGTAALRNFIDLAKAWFDADFSRYNLYLMPIGFVQDGKAVSVSIAADSKKLAQYLESLIKANSGGGEDFNVALTVQLSFVKGATAPVATFGLTNDPSAPTIRLSEEEITQRFPWTYKKVTDRLRSRYRDFKADDEFYKRKAKIEQNPSLMFRRLLDPGNPKSGVKKFYSSNVLNEFDKYYTRK